MKVSAKSEYGVRATVHLARAYGHGPVPLSEIAVQEHISLDFLEQVMVSLRNKGFVKSVRGARGGYLLAFAPDQITVGDVMWSVDGPFVPMQCIEFSGEDQGTCCMGVLKPDCTTRDVWLLLQEKVTETLNSVTLADLCKEAGKSFHLFGAEQRGQPAVAASA